MLLIDTARKSVRETRQEIFSQTVTLLNQALALVAALAWNDAIKQVIDQYFKSGSGIYSHFVYAIILTVFVVIVTRYLNNLYRNLQS